MVRKRRKTGEVTTTHCSSDEARGSKMARATRSRTRERGKRFFRGFIATCQKTSLENPRSATLNTLPRVSHLSGNSWPAQPYIKWNENTQSGTKSLDEKWNEITPYLH